MSKDKIEKEIELETLSLRSPFVISILLSAAARWQGGTSSVCDVCQTVMCFDCQGRMQWQVRDIPFLICADYRLIPRRRSWPRS